MLQRKSCTRVLLAAVALASLSGCTAEDATATAAGLAGDLARQLVAFWLL